MAETREIALTMTLQEGYDFLVHFDDMDVAELLLDEPEPLGGGHGPNAARVLAAAVGNCLSASLLFCLRKSHAEVNGIRTRVRGTITRNERGRLRLAALHVEIAPDVNPEQHARIERCREIFEDFCIVTESVRQGIPIEVELLEPAGT